MTFWPLVAENALGRKLPKEAEVHHIDGNKANSHLSNLVLSLPMEDVSARAVTSSTSRRQPTDHHPPSKPQQT
jgi:hypothetical protein